MHSLLVCDAGPLIILAKLGVLSKWFFELGYQTVVVDLVVAELRRGPFGFRELEEIEAFLKQSKVVSAPKSKPSAESLSLQDKASLIYAEKHDPALLLADDRLLRRAAKQAGVQVIGFLGLLMKATRLGLIPAKDAMNLVDEKIEIHQYRISISLYQALQKELGAFNK